MRRWLVTSVDRATGREVAHRGVVSDSKVDAVKVALRRRYGPLVPRYQVVGVEVNVSMGHMAVDYGRGSFEVWLSEGSRGLPAFAGGWRVRSAEVAS
jgi:hypothetical protein